MRKTRSGVLIQLIAVLISSVFYLYWTWPTYAFNFFYVEANARVQHLTEQEFKLRFFNEFEKQDVTFTRELIEGEKQRLGIRPIQVRYTKFLPDEVIVLGLDPIPRLWLPLIVHLIFLITIIACVRETIKIFSQRPTNPV